MYRYLIILSLFVSACSDDDDGRICESGLDIGNGSCVVYLDNGELDQQREAISAVLSSGYDAVHDIMPVDAVQITVQVAPTLVIPEIGLGGFNPDEQEVIISIDPSYVELEATIENELAPLLAHELHHVNRRRSVGYGSTLFQACVTEGLADHFSMEVFGIDPPIWSVEVQSPELDSLFKEAMPIWHNSPYDHGAWFLGTSSEIPRWAGYSMGYQLVLDYLQENPSRSPSDLYDEPADSFEP